MSITIIIIVIMFNILFYFIFQIIKMVYCVWWRRTIVVNERIRELFWNGNEGLLFFFLFFSFFFLFFSFFPPFPFIFLLPSPFLLN